MSITHCPTCKEPLHQFPSCGQCVNPRCDDYTEHPRLSPLPGHQDLDACLAAPAQVDQVGGTHLPVDVPESDTLWQFLTKGYSLNGIRRALVCGDPHAEAEARMLIERARKNWAQIRAEVGA